MGPKTKLSSYCTRRGNKTVNLVMPRKINTRLARPILIIILQAAIHSSHNDIKCVTNKHCKTKPDYLSTLIISQIFMKSNKTSNPFEAHSTVKILYIRSNKERLNRQLLTRKK